MSSGKLPQVISGYFTGALRRVKLSLGGHVFDFIVDTGFEGEVAIDSQTADLAKLKIIGLGSLKAFDGRDSSCIVASSTMDWFGNQRRCSVDISEFGYRLIGMGLLREANVEVDFYKQLVKLSLK